MYMKKSRLWALAGAHAASLLAVPSVLQAAPAAGQLEEIVVTARQREERIEDVPVSITAFTAADIRSAGIERPQDFIALTPGMAQVQTAEVGDLQVTIRGINTGRDAEPNFALVIDGVLQTNPNALNQELANVTQIEVLKGPQGAVYGRNALAGALIVTTRKPGDEFEADVTAGIGNDSSYNGRLFVGGPLTDGVNGSVSAYTRSTDGQWRNLKIDCDDCVDYFEETGFSGRLLFGLAGGELDFRAKYSELEAGAINFNAAIALADVAPFVGEAFYADPNDHNFRYINNVRPRNEQENLNFSLKGDWDVGFATLTSYVAYNDQTNYFLTDGTSDAFLLYMVNLPPPNSSAAVTECAATNDSNLTDPGYEAPFFGIPSNIWFTPAGNNGAGFLPPYGPSTCGGYQYQQRDQEDLSFELRLTSPGDERLRWLGGVYFADIERDVVVSQGADLGGRLQAKAFVPSSGPNPTDLLYDDTFSSTVYAVFGQLAYDVLDNLELALALRYDSEDREVENNVPTCSATDPSRCRAQTPLFGLVWRPDPAVPAYINPAYSANPGYATSGIPDRSKTFDQLQPKVSANWKITEDFSVFASYGVGFRSGGFNSSGSADTIAQAYRGENGGTTPLCLGASFEPPVCGPGAVYNISDVSDQFDEEVSKAAELGMKSFFLERTLNVNAALFYTDLEDMQFFNFFAGPFGLLRIVTNIDEVTIKGVEADFRWKANDMFSLFGGFAYIDGEIDKYTGRPYTEGGEVPYAPEYTGNLGAELSVPVGSNLALVTRVDASFVGETWFHPVQEQRLPNLFTYFGFGQGEFSKMSRDAYTTVNARMTLQAERWGVTAWSRNLLDEDYLAEIIPAPEFGGSFIHDAQGRTYGLEVNYRF
jgi:iron complex outermembrane recepter protein